MEEENDLTNILIDDEVSVNSPVNLDLPSKEKSPVNRQRPKPLLKCVVCGDNAFGMFKFRFVLKKNPFVTILGYNFDAISCESCKAFFRRNALRPPVNVLNIFSFC